MRPCTLSLLFVAVLAACSADDSVPDPLAGVLASERASALAAARIGKAGGEIAVSSGKYQGVRFRVPAGALNGDAVISLYAAADVDPATGYRSVGPAVTVKGQGAELVNDAIVELPFVAGAITGSAAQSVVILFANDESLIPLSGSHVDEDAEAVRGPTRAFGGFGAAVDVAHARGIAYDDIQARCPRQPGWASLQSAIAGTRLIAEGSQSGAELVGATAAAADGCGYAALWVLTWAAGSRTETFEYGATGASGPGSSGTLTCTAVPFAGRTDSTDLADDFFARTGATPAALEIKLVNCEAAAAPPRFVVTDPASGKFVEYDAAGAFAAKNF